MSSSNPTAGLESVINVEINPENSSDSTRNTDTSNGLESTINVKAQTTLDSIVDVEIGRSPEDLQVEMLERPLEESIDVKGFVQKKLGIGDDGATRRVDISQEAEQENLNDALKQFLQIIQTQDPIDLFVGPDKEGNPQIHTLIVHRNKRSEFYNLTVEEEWIRLLTEKAEEGGQQMSEEGAIRYLERHEQSLKEIAKKLKKVIDQVVPCAAVGSIYTSDSIGILNGMDPLQSVMRAEQILNDPDPLHFIKNILPKTLSEPKYRMVDKQGRLNRRGSKTLKEILASHYLIEGKKMRLYKRLSDLADQEDQLAMTYQEKKRELQKELKEVSSYSKIACMIAIIELNQEVTLIKTEENRKERVTLRQALIEADKKEGSPYKEFELEEIYKLNSKNIKERRKRIERVESLELIKKNGDKVEMSPSTFLEKIENGKGQEYRYFLLTEGGRLDPVAMREVFSLKIEKNFEEMLMGQLKKFYHVDPFSEAKSWFSLRNLKPLSDEESRLSFHLGNLLFYRGATSTRKIDPSFRISSQLRHENRKIPLGQEIRGINEVLPSVFGLGDDETSSEDLDNLISLRGEPEGKTPGQVIKELFG